MLLRIMYAFWCKESLYWDGVGIKKNVFYTNASWHNIKRMTEYKKEMQKLTHTQISLKDNLSLPFTSTKFCIIHIIFMALPAPCYCLQNLNVLESVIKCVF